MMGNAGFFTNKRFSKLREVPDGPSEFVVGVMGKRVCTGEFFAIWPFLNRFLNDVSLLWGVDSVSNEFLRDSKVCFSF